MVNRKIRLYFSILHDEWEDNINKKIGHELKIAALKSCKLKIGYDFLPSKQPWS